jgi:hypothetical protein
VDGRDAILKADSLLYGGTHSCAIWKAFARRELAWVLPREVLTVQAMKG